MKAVIFAGGVGTRLWPLSRKKSPKQFEKIIGDKSTLQLAVERLLPEFSPKDIFISTGQQYVSLIKDQLRIIPKENIVGEPDKKDVGPAVALVISHLARKFADESVVILWSDHLVKNQDRFKKILKEADSLIRSEKEKIIFIGQKPRFASENLGWIEVEKECVEKGGVKFRKFRSFKYRPDKECAQRYFKDDRFCWNLGYFVSTPRFIDNLFKKYTPEIHELTEKISDHLNKDDYGEVLKKNYILMPEINFDKAVLEHLDKNYAYVVVEDIGWSDVGAWEALKEALEEKRQDNITKGRVLLEDSVDNLAYNYDSKKLIVGIDLEDLLIINTNDVLLVAKKTSVPKIKRLVESFQGTENEGLT
ncbi:MAG: mannose-1-phosphate guanylyltransferase [Candidatus Roizmanbacteria bacterium]|nr:MAG: mannose-1-phosphate guanylyltransferase [Candidatus Roizmanbacteria bacterium]